MRRTSYERVGMKNQHIIRMQKPERFKKGVLLSSEPLYLLEFCRKDGERCLMELTKQQFLDLLSEDGITLVHLEASMDEKGNWKMREVRL